MKAIHARLRWHLWPRLLCLGLGALWLAACAAANQALEAGQTTAVANATPLPTSTVSTPALPDLGPAPEITNAVWLNSDAPVTLASVRGQKAVLLEFWTFG